ncbi:hypothetical protein CBW16_10140 [Flavobacteriaceae bacterium JJC]|nr:hypothetical protein CBW16_10140 [Flavobacteriaceae bacterium JJC]
MNRLLIAGMFFAGIALVSAQETKPKEKEEVKKTANIPQTIHNVVDPNHKQHNGYKVKKKTKKGKKYVKRVNTIQNKATIKTKNAGEMDKEVKTVPIK